MAKTYSRKNFHKHTFCNWKACDVSAISGLTPDFKSKSGSQYFFTEAAVYRYSDHWARVANCKWRLEGGSRHGRQLGYAAWDDFHADNDVEKLYYISVDFQSRTAAYEHRDSLEHSEAVLLRNAPDTMKRIRDIRKFLETDSWLAYYDGDQENTRKAVVTALVITDKPVAVVRAETLSKDKNRQNHL